MPKASAIKADTLKSRRSKLGHAGPAHVEPAKPQSTQSLPAHTWMAFTDGASKGNPGLAGAGWLLVPPSGGTVLRQCKYLGRKTCNQAEYAAILLALKQALAIGVKRLHVCADSQLLVRQVLGIYQVRHPSIVPLFDELCGLIKQFDYFYIEHVRREFNMEADKLANKALTEQMPERSQLQALGNVDKKG